MTMRIQFALISGRLPLRCTTTTLGCSGFVPATQAANENRRCEGVSAQATARGRSTLKILARNVSKNPMVLLAIAEDGRSRDVARDEQTRLLIESIHQDSGVGLSALSPWAFPAFRRRHSISAPAFIFVVMAMVSSAEA
ncbi:hypothetical protein ABIF73_000875 [Bradyrhizobium japonicum]|uniref:hypothetical protein n=1 Tax=Bradyrhizobium japonicum TaxID=375 RepID=UPI00339A9E77